jgi:hypothetical protein
MKAFFGTEARLVLGLLTITACALPQAYTISAKPGAVNYMEGPASINGQPITANSKKIFLNANDTLETGSASKAEVLLAPGVFVRLGAASSIKMITPSLVNTEIEVTGGEVVVEMAQYEAKAALHIIDHGAVTTPTKTGLYRFEGQPALVQVLDGKVEVEDNGKRVELGKDHELALDGDSKAQKFSAKKAEDDLYAWSKVRDQYVSAASYSAARNVSIGNGFDAAYGGGYFGPYGGLGSFYGPGWFWNSGFNSWAWLPGDGAFFSPFGYGFFAPNYIAYAPVVYVPVNGSRPVPVPVNPSKPVKIAGVTTPPVVPGRGPVTAANWSHVANGAHVTSAAMAHTVAAPARTGGGGYSGGAVASSPRASTPMPASMPRSAAPSGGGSHH